MTQYYCQCIKTCGVCACDAQIHEAHKFSCVTQNLSDMQIPSTKLRDTDTARAVIGATEAIFVTPNLKISDAKKKILVRTLE